MDTAYGIFEYNTNNFSAYISYQTDTPLNHIKQKPQITYIDNYISKLTIGKKVVFIYENEYVDKHYLEDYSAYYVSCFTAYRKTCSRVHFFQIEEEEDYKNAFKKTFNNEPSFVKNENYLGYIVIRPIPQTFLAEICLKPFHIDEERLKKFILYKIYEISLFGVPLEIKSIACQEQDKILSACATTSLWSFFHAHPMKCRLDLPSSSAITRSAYPEKNGFHREFPNSGLSTDMICRSMREYDLTPEHFDFTNILGKNKRIKYLKEYIYSYCSSGLPLIMGVLIKDSKTEKEKGLHAVTILGYSLKDDHSNVKLMSHNIEKIYVHDDRVGPFLRVEFEKDTFKVSLDANSSVTENNIFDNEIYLPSTLIIGLYHKIRIPYLRIKNTCMDLQKSIIEFLENFGFQREANLFKEFVWDIQIRQNKDIKSAILKSKIKNKEKYLTKSWPKYLWSATVFYENQQIFEIIFDATDISQGDVFLDIIPIHEEYTELIVELIKRYAYAHFKDKIHLLSTIKNEDNYVWGIIKYFRDKESYISTLSDLYGYLKIPAIINKEELVHGSIINSCEVRLNKENNYEDFQFDNHINSFKYIWVIDKEGFLCIGKEYDNTRKGHPTLTDGMPARIGGELKFNPSENVWEVNPFSGRYSSEYTNEEKKKFIKNVIQYKFSVYFPSEKFATKELKK